MEKTITHQEFIDGYKSGEFIVSIDKSRAGDFVLSNFADKHNKPAYLFWSWSGIILSIPAPIILLFINWHYSIVFFIVGLVIVGVSKKSTAGFIFRNMLENESFWEYILLHKGATIKDKEGNEVTSAFLGKMKNR